MNQLVVKLFGPLEIYLAGQPASGFDSDKVRALLAYLIVEAGLSFRRERLAGLLWPEFPERSARTNLRRALANLRQVIGDSTADPPFLLVTRQTIQFNAGSDYVLDVTSFSDLVQGREGGSPSSEDLEEAITLYRGDFLEGFSVSDSAPFEEWALINRESFQGQAMRALVRLSSYFEGQGQYEKAIQYTRQQVKLEPYQEEGHRQLMRSMALSGRRGEALAHYERCRQLLFKELDIEPSPETRALYERIQRGELKRDVTDLALRSVKGYEVRELIGMGHFGAVYRAYQPVVARDVAIKIILPHFADDPDFIRRFEAEAQLVARLEHPNIVPLYDYWREPGGAFLVMRWLRGCLKDSLARGPWNPEPAAQLVNQIAAGLSVAHRQGVVHRDIKPANILLDEDSNAYLSDFGIAILTGPLSTLVFSNENTSGSLGYLSPESIEGKEATILTDIYSFGVVLYELLTAKNPFPGFHGQALLDKHLHEPLPRVSEERPEMPPAVDEVIWQATAKDPTQRYPDAQTLAEAFRQALFEEAYVTLLPEVTIEIHNPYKGLRPFQEADAADFFGREALVKRLVTCLGAPPNQSGTGDRFLAVVGPSGSGKSSVVRAGLIPVLREGKVTGSEAWFIAEMTPGSRPMEEVEAALLRIAVNPPESLLNQLEEGQRGLLRAVRRILAGDDCQLLLLIDQFEELFTLVEDEDQRQQFLESLLVAIKEPGSPLRLIITLRADFYDRPLQYPGFGELLSQHTQVLLPLSPVELEQAISGPAKRVGVTLEPELMAGIFADVSDQPGALPLLQYALTELFEGRQERVLTLEAYKASGGVSGALGHRAEALYHELDMAGQAVARQIFLRLVTLGEGLEDTRRRALRAECEALDPSPQSLAPSIIDAFGAARLLTFDRELETRAPTVEIAHEALLKEWLRLRDWIDNSRDDLRTYRRLTNAVREWENAGRHMDFLLRGYRLELFADWAKESDIVLSHAEKTYLEVSLAQQQARADEESARQEREKALERRSRNRLQALAVVLLAAAITAIGLTLFAFSLQQQAQESAVTATVAQGLAQFEAATARLAQGEALIQANKAATAAAEAVTQKATAEAEAAARATQESIAITEADARATQRAIAESQARHATARELALAARANLEIDPELSILLALTAAKTTNDVDGVILREAEEVLHQALQTSRVDLTLSPAFGASFSPDGGKLATAGPDNKVRIWDVASGEIIDELNCHAELFRAVYSPDGTRFVTTSFVDPVVRVLDATNGEELLTLSGHNDGVLGASWSEGGDLLVTASLDGTARIWEADTGEELSILPHSDFPLDADFNPGGTLVATNDLSAGVARIWDTKTGDELLTLEGHDGDVNEVAFSPEGDRLATISADKTAKIWDAETGEELLTLTGHTGFVSALDYSPDGALLATGAGDGLVKIWDAMTGEELHMLNGHKAGIDNISFSPDGQRVASGSDDGTVKVWDVTFAGSRDWLTLDGHTNLIFNVEYSKDGRRLATTSWDGTGKVWDANTGQLLVTLDGHTAELSRLLFSPDETQLATSSYDGTAKVWDAVTGEEQLTLTGHESFVFGMAYSPDGQRLATASDDGTVKIWDAYSGEQLMTIDGHEGSVFRVIFTPDGNRLATAGWDNTARIWNADSGEALHSLPTDHFVNAIAFSPDGNHLATGTWNGSLQVWDVESGRELRTLAGHPSTIWDVAYTPDGTQLASLGFDPAIRIWDASSGEELLRLEVAGGGPDLAFSPDGDRLATGGDLARIFIIPVEELMVVAQSRLTRSFTDDECRQYLHQDECSSP